MLDGVRVDHPDGLRDPLEYFDRLREGFAERVDYRREDSGVRESFLRKDWPIEGTSGYDFMNVALGLLVRPQGMAELSAGVWRVHAASRRCFRRLRMTRRLRCRRRRWGRM